MERAPPLPVGEIRQSPYSRFPLRDMSEEGEVEVRADGRPFVAEYGVEGDNLLLKTPSGMSETRARDFSLSAEDQARALAVWMVEREFARKRTKQLGVERKTGPGRLP